MTFVSYAQNFEDVLLWRALGMIGTGFYIDVGAAHPEIDSVTRAFYDRGWRGINIEPVTSYAQRLRTARQRDVTLQVALAEAPGQATFFTVPGTGLSTLEGTVAEAYHAQGFMVEAGSVPVETLAAICRQHAPKEIHFLKIDVEGAERAVLAGADFERYRPWVVLVEATKPMSTEQNHEEWEPLLLQAGYRFAWFDGLNRFYLAAERHAELAPHFAIPVNVFDDFLRAADTEWAKRIATAEAAMAELRERAIAAEHRSGEASRQLLAGFSEASRTKAERDQAMEAGAARLQVALDHERGRTEHERGRADRAEDWLAAMRASTSWQLTKPLREAIRLLRGNTTPTPATSPVPPMPGPPPLPRQENPAPVLVAAPSAPIMRSRPNGPVHTVHQFHSGSAVGDAITNCMLLIRRMLRGMGYASDIYVEHRDPFLDGELRLIDELPQHAGYVLLLHHSMGYDAFDRVMALPAAKVLAYHNITPVEFLAGNPVMQSYARLGRQQLALLPPQVAAAVAMSEYNATELRGLGFDPVRACNLLFDMEDFRARALRRSAAGSTPFTILFVGRVTASKGQLELLEAFIKFRTGYPGPARLVLVGRPDDGSGYIEALHARVVEAGLGTSLLVTGLVSDAELRGWYAAADLYVSLSLHEGFGVPLVEAIASGVPVLAWPSGAIPYTLGLPVSGEPSGLLSDRSADAVAAQLRDLAVDPAALAALAQAQRRAADRFRLDLQLPVLAEALALAGAIPPPGPDAAAALKINLRFTVTGHANGSYSLASVNRTLASVLEAAFPSRVRLAPIEGHDRVALKGVPPGSTAALLATRRPFDSGPQVVISNHYPIHLPAEPGDLPLALFYWEESLVPATTIALLDSRFRGVLVATASVAKALLDSGLTIPVRILGQSLELGPYLTLADRRLPRPKAAPTTLLHVSSCFPRKGVDSLLVAYAEAFRAGDPVRLVIKGFPNPHNDVAEQIAALRARDPGVAPIKFINRDLDAAEMLALYAEADAMVLPSRGEGFNMAAAEAMAAGLPLIVTGAGGHRDFCVPETARLIEWRHAPSQTHLAVPHSLWFEPDRADLAAALQETVAACRATGEATDALAARTRRARAAIVAATDGPTLAERLATLATRLLLAPPPRPPRMVWVTSWAVRCGVAEYTRHMLDSIPEAKPRLTVLADTRTTPVERNGGPRVLTPWRLGDAESIPNLARAIAAADPDIVMIQHQPGLLGFEALASLLRAPELAGRAVSVTLHTVEQLVDAVPAIRDETVAALSGAGRIIVHTLADLERLHRLNLVANATLIPQGGRPQGSVVPLRQLDPGTRPAPRIGCYGFFLPGKGIPQLIEAVGLLRRRWPGLRLRLVNAAYDSPVSQAEIAECRALAVASGLEDAIEWQTDFLPDAVSMALLAECDMIALPTQASREGSSASLRNVLTTGLPVVVTPLGFYEEAADAVARFDGTSPEALATGLDALLGDVAARRRYQDAARHWLEERAWSAIGPRTLRMLTGLAMNRIV